MQHLTKNCGALLGVGMLEKPIFETNCRCNASNSFLPVVFGMPDRRRMVAGHEATRLGCRYSVQPGDVFQF